MSLNFLQEDFSEVVGAYFDGEKIYLSRHINGNVENFDANFSVEDDVSEIEQLAEKISLLCYQRGWKTSKMGLCLREGVAITFQTPFGTIPPEEIDNSVKIWAISQVDEDALFDSIKFGEEIWMEAISKATATDYVNAWQKNSMTLCALTVMPEEFDAQINLTKPQTYADYVADVVANKKTPNLIKDRLSAWNYKKISVAIAITFFCVLLGIFVKTSYEYHVASAQVEELQNYLDGHADEVELKKSVEEDIAEMKRLNSFCAAQENPFPKFNALVKLGKIADGKIYLTKIKMSDNSIELEGVANNSDDIKNYVSRLKTITTNVKPGNFSSKENIITFTIYLTLKN
ncbi:MAG: PilN domain-containing protein [Selenomonadaceae bacterium]|nr:PilN domain-containing protein [Selenomonadaceae bacterium]